MRVLWRSMLISYASACRLGFDDDAIADAMVAPSDGVQTGTDVPATERTETWGEALTADHRNVTTDTTLDENSPTLNFGDASELKLEEDDVPLVRFDLGALAPGTQITGAQLRVFATTNHGEIGLHRLLEPWDEGGLDGSPGVANWNDRMTGLAWTSAGAGAPASRESIAIASIPAEVSGPVTVDVPAASIQQWVDAPATNHGLAFVVGASESSGILSREAAASSRPLLTITYVP